MSLQSCTSSCILLLAAASAYGQAIITTAAGGGFVNNAPALQSHLANPQGVAVDAAGNVFISDSGRILELNHTSGNLTAVAGTGPGTFNKSDGPALSVTIAPTYLAMNSSGILFLDSSMLRQLNLQQGTITTIAGKSGSNADTGDGGPAAGAQLNAPQQFCVDAARNIYIVELAGYVRRISASTGVITTIAGTSGSVFGGDGGPATAATLVQPKGIAIDTAGNLYIADSYDLRIRKIAAGTQTMSTIAGTGHQPSGGDGGSALSATFSALGELAIDGQGNLTLIDGDRIRRISAATGVITTVTGNGAAGFTGDGGLATKAEVNVPVSVALDGAGNLYIADSANQRVRMVAATTGVINSIAGSADGNGDGGLAPGGVLNNPMGVAVNSAGDIFISSGTVVRKVTHATGIISTFAGGGNSTADGIPALQAQLNPIGLAVDSSGSLLIGEPGLIRKVDSSGTIRTIAGTGVSGFSGDGGQATSAKIAYVTAMAFDSSGTLLFTDSGNKRVRRINTSTGVIATVAGNGQAIFNGTTSNATQFGIGDVAGLAVDASDNIYIGGINTYYLLKISAAGAVSIFGGVGGCGYIGDGGLATLAAVCQPSAMAADSTGNLFVADSSCFCVRRIAADTGIIQTVAGNGVAGYVGDNGIATNAEMRSLNAIAISGSSLYIADGKAAVVRGVTPDTPPAMPGIPTFSQLVSSASFQGGGIAPGELVSFFGHYLGPSTPANWSISNNHAVNPDAGVQVFFDDLPATLIYVTAGQINAIAPYAVANGLHTVRVEAPGGTVSTTTATSIGSAPAIFPNAIVNQDGTINGPAHPAPAGTYVVMYGTGLGQTTPAGVDGAVTVDPVPTQVYSIHLSVSQNPLFANPIPMQLLYGGPAPGLISGVSQVNAVIPDGLTPGENFLTIAAGPGPSAIIPLYVK